MSSGLIIGKFLPPHRGHEYLVNFARSFAERITVQVCSIASEPIPGSIRHAWMQEIFGAVPGITVVHNSDENPQVPEDCPDRFWEIWRDSICRRMNRQPDFLFASEDYGVKLAEVVGARYIPVDHDRQLFPISGSAIREDPMTNWQFILPAARPWFLKRVAIVGPESSGKSTLARNLASRFKTCYAPEYGRSYLDAVGFNLDEDAIVAIARGHRASEEALAREANRVLISDTECLITKMWSAELIGSVPDIVEEMVRESRYDLYLVSTTTQSWVADAQRVQPEIAARRAFEKQCIDALADMGRKYLVLTGDWRQREEQAFAAISKLISDMT